MTRVILLTILSLSIMFPGKGVSQSISIDDLIIRNNLFYKKFTDIPYSGKVSGIQNGRLVVGERQGMWTFYYKSGQLEKKGSYNFGIKKGFWEIYWLSGQIFRQGNYVNGKKEGLWLDYHENGQLWDIGSYKLGNKNGSWKTYWDHGGLYSKGEFKLGKAEGFWTYFKTDGTLDHLFTGKYSEGKKISN